MQVRSEFETDLLVRVGELARVYASQALASSADADDVAQQVVLEMLERMRRNRPVSDVANIGALVRRMVRCRVADLCERGRRRRVREADYASAHDGDPHTWMSPEYELEELELEHCGTRALANLPEKCRRAFVMVQLEDVSYNEAAAALHVSRSTVCGYVVLARKQLREGLRALGIEPPGPRHRTRSLR